MNIQSAQIVNKKYLRLFVLLTTFSVLLIGFDWGLPSEKRLDLIIENKDTLDDRIMTLLESKNKLKKKSHYYDHMDFINMGVYEFLLFPYAGDDHFIIKGIKNLNPRKLQFDPKYYLYGGGLVYTGAAFLQLASWVDYIKVVSDERVYLKHPDEMRKIFMVLRFMVVLFAVSGICLIYWIAYKYFGEKIAFVSWGIILATPVTHQASHTIEPHIFVLPIFILSFYFSLKSLSSNITKSYTLAAIFAGLSIGTQMTSFYIVFPFFMSLVINYREKRIGNKDVFKHSMLYVFVSIVAMLVINPFYILNYKAFLENLMFGTGSHLHGSFHNTPFFEISGFLCLLFVCSIGYHCFQLRNEKDNVILMFLSCALGGIIVYVMTGFHDLPYVYSSVPLMATLSAIMVVNIYLSIKGRMKIAFSVLIIPLFLLSPVARSAYYLKNFNSKNQDVAGEWINKNIPKGSTVGVFFPPTTWDCVAFNFYNYKLVEYRTLDPLENSRLPETILTVEHRLPEMIKEKYKVVKAFKPKTVFGYSFELRGELHALIAKTIKIYSLKENKSN